MREQYYFYWTPDSRFPDIYPERKYICKSLAQAKKLASDKIKTGLFGFQTHKVYIFREILFDTKEEAEDRCCYSENWQECSDLLRLGYMHESGNSTRNGFPLYATWKDDPCNDYTWWV